MSDRRHKKPPVKRVLLLLDWYSRSYHKGAARYAREAGWVLDAGPAHGSVGEWISNWRGNGIIAMLHGQKSTAEFCRKAEVPVVDLACQCTELPFPRVLHDNEQHGRIVARHFLKRGFRHFAFCCASKPLWSEKERFNGFSSRVAEECGARVHRMYWNAPKRPRKSVKAGPQALAAALRDLPTPLAVMAHNDDVGVKVIDACLNAGLLVPEQVAVVGCDNDELICDYAPVPLSSVDPDLERQAYEGAALLSRLMDGKRAPSNPQRTPPIGLVIRQSSDIMAVEHVEVAKALRFIWDHYPDPLLGVDDIVRATTLSKTGLNNAFQQHMKCAIGEEVRRIRLLRAKELLRGTKTSVVEIAASCGYSDDKHLRNSLRRDSGLSPRAWREQALD